MKKVTYYQTASYRSNWDGYGSTKYTKKFETIEAAKEDAMTERFDNYDYRLFKVTLTFKGIIEEDIEDLGSIPCRYEIEREKNWMKIKHDSYNRTWYRPTTHWTEWTD